jgi:hypothetical protein
MVKIVKKGFPGQLVGVGIIILVVYISSEFNVDTKTLFKVIFISIGVISIIFSLFWNQIFEGLINLTELLFNSYSYDDRIRRLKTKIDKIQDSTEIKKLIISFTKKEKFKLYDLTSLIRGRKVIDDDFWINVFLDSIKEIPRTRTNLIDFDGFLGTLRTDESRGKLKRILISKGILIDDKLWW